MMAATAITMMTKTSLKCNSVYIELCNPFGLQISAFKHICNLINLHARPQRRTPLIARKKFK